MLWKFLVERRSWLLFILLIEGIMGLMLWLDADLPAGPILYVMLLIGIGAVLFSGWRYWREMGFYREMVETNDVHELMNAAQRPLERLVVERLSDQLLDMQTRLSERTTELEQEQKELEMWIHEMKTPLTTLHLLAEQVGDEALQQQMDAEWTQMSHLLDLKLHQHKKDFIHNDIFMTNCKLAPLIREQILPLQAWSLERGVGFEVELEVAEVTSDAKWLGFMLRQILTNAVKYSRDSEVEVRSRYLESGQVELLVRDHGRGIAAVDLPQIFARGFTSTRHHMDQAATGMGLFLTKEVAEALYIALAVDSVEGVGTTFTFTFPLANPLVEVRRQGKTAPEL
jgi:OmpR family two-component system bacitracin resistance sensor histidine kinase BceS